MSWIAEAKQVSIAYPPITHGSGPTSVSNYALLCGVVDVSVVRIASAVKSYCVRRDGRCDGRVNELTDNCNNLLFGHAATINQATNLIES